jgi:hypothetical protein
MNEQVAPEGTEKLGAHGKGQNLRTNTCTGKPVYLISGSGLHRLMVREVSSNTAVWCAFSLMKQTQAQVQTIDERAGCAPETQLAVARQGSRQWPACRTRSQPVHNKWTGPGMMYRAVVRDLRLHCRCRITCVPVENKRKHRSGHEMNEQVAPETGLQ